MTRWLVALCVSAMVAAFWLLGGLVVFAVSLAIFQQAGSSDPFFQENGLPLSILLGLAVILVGLLWDVLKLARRKKNTPS